MGTDSEETEKAGRGDVVVLRLTGALDCLSVADTRSAIDTLIAQGYRKIEVDISTLRLIDATGVGALVALYRRVSADNGWMWINGARDQPLAIFRLLNLDKVLFKPRQRDAHV